MSDIEKRLSSLEKSNTPKRELSDAFTMRVVSEIKNGDHEPKRWYQAHNPFQRVAMGLGAIMIVVVLLGGGTYALTGKLPFFGASLVSSDVLRDGSELVAIDVHNCSQSNVNVNSQKETGTSDRYYYQIYPNSPVSKQDVIEMAQAECELLTRPEMIRDLSGTTKPRSGYYVKFDQSEMRVVSVSKNNLTLLEKQQLGSFKDADKPEYFIYKNRTFDSIADDVKVYASDGSAISLSDIQADQLVQVLYESTSLPSASLDNNDRESRVLAIQQLPPHYSTALKFASYYGNAFKRVTPCDTNANGYCEKDVDPTLVGPSDYKSYIEISTAINTLREAYDGYIAKRSVAAFVENADAALGARITNDPLKVLMCDSQQPKIQLSYVGKTEDGSLIMEAGNHQFATQDSLPYMIYEYNQSTKKFNSISCVDNREYNELLDKYE